MTAKERMVAPIAFSHYSAPNDISGVTTWLRDLLLHLHAQGVPLVVLLHHFGRDVSQSSLLPVLRQAGIQVEIVPQSATMEEDVRGVLDFLDRHRPVLFLPQCLNSMYYAAAIAGKQGLPWVLTMHSDDPDYWAIAEALPPEKHGGRMVCVSKHIAALAVEKKLARHPVIIPYGVRTTEERTCYSADPFTIAYCGRMVEEQKRASLVVRTLIAACQQGQHIRAVLMGEGKARPDCQRLVEEAGLADRIVFTGALDAAAVRAQLLKSQALLLMSDYEGLPVALLEAMALGVVPVVRDIPSGVPELVEDGVTGCLVESDPGSAGLRISDLAADRALWENCSRSGSELIAAKYDSSISQQAWFELTTSLRVQKAPGITIPRRIKLPVRDGRLSKGYRPPPTRSEHLMLTFLRYRQALGRRLKGGTNTD